MPMPPTQVTPLDQGICGIWLKAVPLYQNISILGHIQVLDQQKSPWTFWCTLYTHSTGKSFVMRASIFLLKLIQILFRFSKLLSTYFDIVLQFSLFKTLVSSWLFFRKLIWGCRKNVGYVHYILQKKVKKTCYANNLAINWYQLTYINKVIKTGLLKFTGPKQNKKTLHEFASI